MLRIKPGMNQCHVRLVLESGEIRYLRSRGQIATIPRQLADSCLCFVNKFGYAHIENNKYSGEIFGPIKTFRNDVHFTAYNINVVKKVLIEEI